MDKIKICHLYHDVLNLYGDTGNVITMKKRLEWRGFETEVTDLSFGEFDLSSKYDIIFIGGGQDFEQGILTEDLFKYKSGWLKEQIENGTVVLAICGGYQMLGNYYITDKGENIKFLGAVDIYTKASSPRMIGNIVYSTELNGKSPVAAFENHSGKTYLGKGVSPLGKVVKGFGNNGEDGTEGARYKNVFATYGHGPLLPKNPVLCDSILLTALKAHGVSDLSELDDRVENAALENALGLYG
ncbi:MAG: glutamine amidotransferase [Ruminococcus sp.]|nr:glutamine amidotransferase [Ruminococcus sp.]